MTILRVAFVMEQTLGHVTHSRNLQTLIRQQERVAATWVPIDFEVAGAARLVPLVRNNWSVRASWRARRALGQELGRARHDALFFHSQVTSLFSVDLMRRYPSLVSMDATPINFDTMGEFYDHRPAGSGFIARQKYEMNRRAFQAAAGLVAWSDWAKASLERDYGIDAGKVRVLAPGAAAQFFEIGDARNMRGIPRPGSPVRILFVGGDFVRKGGPELLAALPGGCELDIVTKDAIEARSNVRVHHGLKPNSRELLDLFRSADLFVLPSRGECLALVLMEATAAGLPVITTSVGALAEAVCPESGIVVPDGEVASLQRALEALVVDPSRRYRMGKAGNLLARQKFDAHVNNNRILDFLAEVGSSDQLLRRTA